VEASDMKKEESLSNNAFLNKKNPMRFNKLIYKKQEEVAVVT
jgi:hypothetical protein